MVRCFCVTCGNLLVLGNGFLYGKRGKNSKKYPNCVKRNDDTKSFLCLFFFFTSCSRGCWEIYPKRGIIPDTRLIVQVQVQVKTKNQKKKKLRAGFRPRDCTWQHLAAPCLRQISSIDIWTVPCLLSVVRCPQFSLFRRLLEKCHYGISWLHFFFRSRAKNRMCIRRYWMMDRVIQVAETYLGENVPSSNHLTTTI